MDVATAQYLCLAGLFFGVLLFLLAPVFLLTGKFFRCTAGDLNRYQGSIDLSNCFSGGVFLATFFVGLLPEVRQDVDKLLVESSLSELHLPVTECVVILGFFLALFLERLAMAIKSKNSHSHSHSHAEIATASFVDVNHEYGQNFGQFLDEPVTIQELSENVHGHHHHGHSHDIGALVGADSLVRFGMLLLSLSVHSIFEGMALGLQEEMHTLVNLFVGIWIHECLIAFALGVNVTKMKLSTRRIFAFGVMFAALLPVGQLMGIFIGRGKSAAIQAVSACLQAVAAGTFVHVTFFEIIPECLTEGCLSKRLLRVFLLFVGFVVISVVTWFSYAL